MTKENKIYQVLQTQKFNQQQIWIVFKDLVHTEQAWPAWMDTVGLDEGDAEHVNGELVQKYLLFEATDIQEVILLLFTILPKWSS